MLLCSPVVFVVNMLTGKGSRLHQLKAFVRIKAVRSKAEFNQIALFFLVSSN